MSLNKRVASGVGGCLLCCLLTLLAIPLRAILDRTFSLSDMLVLLGQPLLAWAVFIIFITLALIEIPLMIYGLRKIVEGRSKSAEMMSLIGNGVFTFFPVVYALPNLLMTTINLVWLGWLISATSFLRVLASLFFLKPQP